MKGYGERAGEILSFSCHARPEVNPHTWQERHGGTSNDEGALKDKQHTLSPGQCEYHAPKHWECWAPTPAAAPLGPRNTMGTCSWNVRYYVRNFWVKGGNLYGTSYLKAYPLGNRCPE
ncbi:hypothetical protein E2C01_015846 [Portunus trituberculatus]|uniref:Uncharacterized protein n=1 Tax=Portunus trituberculatus TaxID=210409 RepID=A0A5B7DMX7_PORTR|nr:hypothetical protein [Portunus trituberculatus]